MIRKQFIAGARCPACNAQDKVRFCRDGEREWLECVACGHATENPGAAEYPNSPEATEIGIIRLPQKK
jgi:uncharacterized metal-binding protein (TIGR02443 family)